MFIGNRPFRRGLYAAASLFSVGAMAVCGETGHPNVLMFCIDDMND